jgi:hypothetical protein
MAGFSVDESSGAKREAIPSCGGGSVMGLDIAEIRMTLKELAQRLNTIGGHL